MKTKSKKIDGVTPRGTKGFRFESNLEVGMRVKREGFDGTEEGKIVGPGIAGMPEVEWDGGGSDYAMPHELEIISSKY